MIRFEEVFLKKSIKLRQDAKYPVLFRCVVPSVDRAEALLDLDLMRVNYLSVYPDFEGLSRYVKSRLLSRL